MDHTASQCDRLPRRYTLYRFDHSGRIWRTWSTAWM